MLRALCKYAWLLPTAIGTVTTVGTAACSGPKKLPHTLQVKLEVSHQPKVICPVASGITALPQEAFVSSDIMLAGFATSSQGTHFSWLGPGGDFSTPTRATTRYRCNTVGEHVVTLKITKTGCPISTLPVELICSAADALGVAGFGGGGGM